MLDSFVDADLYWDGSRLLVNADWQHDADSLDNVSSLLLYTIKFELFSLTRWVKVGSSARLFLKAQACGMVGVVELCRQDPAVSMYHMNGYYKAK